MSVYVDDMYRAARVGGIRGRWSHLFADDSIELTTFAEELGLKPGWIQHAGTIREHYDLTASVRLAALRLGAVAIRYPHETGALIGARRAGVRFDLTAHRAASRHVP